MQKLINMLDEINMLEGQNMKSSKHVEGANLLNRAWMFVEGYMSDAFFKDK